MRVPDLERKDCLQDIIRITKPPKKFLENLAFNIPGMNFMNQPDYIIILMNGKSKPGGCVKIAEGEVYHEGI